jgi:micrococcal nuclease
MNKNGDLIIATEEPSPNAVEVPVLEVFDGNGFLIRLKSSMFTDNLSDQSEMEVTARFGFVDAPELDQPGGPEAKAFLETLIGGRNVWIAILTKSHTGRPVDRHVALSAFPISWRATRTAC